MTDIRHYLNGVLVNPRDFKFNLKMDWKGKKEDANVNIENIELVGNEGKLFRQRAFNGLSGGVGIFEGEPYKIEIGPIGNPTGVFEGYLDMSKNLRLIGDCDVEVGITKKQGLDWISEVADAFSYRYLEEIGVITDSDFVDTPYVINYIPDGAQLLILGISTFVLTKELIEAVKATADRIADLTDAATPVVGTSVGLGAGVVTAYDIGNIIMAALKLVAQLAYLAAIVVALVKLMEQIIEELMPPKRFHKGMPIRLLFQRACDYLNLDLKSDLLDSIDTSSNKWVLMPSKRHRGGEKPTNADSSWRETGVPSRQDSVDTFGGVIRTFRRKFNARYQIKDGCFIFERRDKFRGQSTYKIPSVFTNQDNYTDEVSLNTDEIKANYNINWAYDVQDQNTLDVVEGSIFQAQLKPKVSINPELRTLKGLESVDIPFSQAIRKNELTEIEKAVKALVSVADFITGQLGNPSSLSGKINARIGSMHLSSHFTTIPKVVVMSGSILAKNQRVITSARSLWEKFHFINSFKKIESNGKFYHNQYYIYLGQRVPFCFEDFLKLICNNLVVLEDTGEEAELYSLDWNISEGHATLDYAVNRLYDDNFEIVYLP